MGRNASGKTSALEAINVMLGAYLAAYKNFVASREVFNITGTDVLLSVRNSNDPDIIISPYVPQYPCVIGCSLRIDENKFKFSRMLEKEGGRTKFGGSNPMQRIVSKWEHLLKEGGDESLRMTLPIVLYFSSSRLWSQTQKRDGDVKLPIRTDAYYRCLDNNRGIQWAFDYLKSLSYVANQEKSSQPFPAFTAIMEAINECMREELPEGDVVEFSMRYGEFVQKKSDGIRIPFKSLSDGYRNIMRIVADIAVRMCILNPQFKENSLKETPGIILIDEIDLSLHPTWQRRIINTLQDIFPKVQFICATHSPFVIQSLKEGQLISISEEIDVEYSGESIEDIAEDVMGVEIPQYSEHKIKMYEAAEKYYTAVRNAASVEEIEKLRLDLAMLSKRFGDNPAYYAILEQEHLTKAAELEKKYATGE